MNSLKLFYLMFFSFQHISLIIEKQKQQIIFLNHIVSLMTHWSSTRCFMVCADRRRLQFIREWCVMAAIIFSWPTPSQSISCGSAGGGHIVDSRGLQLEQQCSYSVTEVSLLVTALKYASFEAFIFLFTVI